MKYTNGTMELMLVLNLKDYSVFKRGEKYIVAWLPSFNQASRTVEWSQGRYDLTIKNAFEYLAEKEEELSDEYVFYLLDMQLIAEDEVSALYEIIDNRRV